jgi:hypothetical protein
MAFGSSCSIRNRSSAKAKIVVSLNEAHGPKLNVADKLLTLQKNRLLGSVGSSPCMACHAWLASDVALVL